MNPEVEERLQSIRAVLQELSNELYEIQYTLRDKVARARDAIAYLEEDVRLVQERNKCPVCENSPPL